MNSDVKFINQQVRELLGPYFVVALTASDWTKYNLVSWKPRKLILSRDRHVMFLTRKAINMTETGAIEFSGGTETVIYPQVGPNDWFVYYPLTTELFLLPAEKAQELLHHVAISLEGVVNDDPKPKVRTVQDILAKVTAIIEDENWTLSASDPDKQGVRFAKVSIGEFEYGEDIAKRWFTIPEVLMVIMAIIAHHGIENVHNLMFDTINEHGTAIFTFQYK